MRVDHVLEKKFDLAHTSLLITSCMKKWNLILTLAAISFISTSSAMTADSHPYKNVDPSTNGCGGAGEQEGDDHCE